MNRAADIRRMFWSLQLGDADITLGLHPFLNVLLTRGAAALSRKKCYIKFYLMQKSSVFDSSYDKVEYVSKNNTFQQSGNLHMCS